MELIIKTEIIDKETSEKLKKSFEEFCSENEVLIMRKQINDIEVYRET